MSPEPEPVERALAWARSWDAGNLAIDQSAHVATLRDALVAARSVIDRLETQRDDALRQQHKLRAHASDLIVLRDRLRAKNAALVSSIARIRARAENAAHGCTSGADPMYVLAIEIIDIADAGSVAGSSGEPREPEHKVVGLMRALEDAVERAKAARSASGVPGDTQRPVRAGSRVFYRRHLRVLLPRQRR